MVLELRWDLQAVFKQTRWLQHYRAFIADAGTEVVADDYMYKV